MLSMQDFNSDDLSYFTQLKERVVRNFLDIIVLFFLNNKANKIPKDFLLFCNDKLQVKLEPELIFNALLVLENKGLIKGRTREDKNDHFLKRYYILTRKGKTIVDVLEVAQSDLRKFMGL